MARPPDLLKPQEVAPRCQVSIYTLARWRARGIGPPFLKHGRVIRYSRIGLDRWLEDQAEQAS
jgi:hypothetical protein